MPIQFNDFDTAATKKILPGVAENFFKGGPLMAYLRNRFTDRWTGISIQANFRYKPMKGGAYAPGAAFDITKRQTRTGLIFTPRYLAA